MYYKTKEDYIKVVGVICGEQDTLPYYGEEITEEEYNSIMANIEEHQAKVEDYAQKIMKGEMTLDEVPADYKDEVLAYMPTKYTLDEAATILASRLKEGE